MWSLASGHVELTHITHKGLTLGCKPSDIELVLILTIYYDMDLNQGIGICLRTRTPKQCNSGSADIWE